MKEGFPEHFNHFARIASLVLVAGVSLGPMGSISAKSHKVVQRPIIRVGIYNYAEADPAELMDAEHHAAALLKEAGVKITWRDYTHQRRSLRTPSVAQDADFFIRILFASAMKRSKQTAQKGALGQAFIPPGIEGPTAGRFANVYYDRVTALVPPPGPCSKQVLGDAIAHEIGHLLLGPQHSPRGIMKAVWALQEMELITCCRMRFSPEQAMDLQQAARAVEPNSSPVVAARR